VAVGSARPNPKARRVTARMCRALLQHPDLTDEDAERLLDHLYMVADVAVDAFIEQRGRVERKSEHEPVAELIREALASVADVA
jgi:hypothetical protein